VTRISVAKLPKNPGPAAWNEILPSTEASPILAENITADWLIIGAGFAGLAAARRLRQLHPTDKIVILEAHGIAHGPAGRNSGFMIDLPHDLTSKDYGGSLQADIALTALNRHAISFAQDMAVSYNLTPEAFVQSGKINGAATLKGDQHNQEYAAHLTAMGEEHSLLDAVQMHALTGIRYYRSGLFTPGSAMLQPALFVRGVAQGLRGEGVSIFEYSPVAALEHVQDWVAETPKGRVTAPKVILAVNGHLNSFGFAKNRLMHVFTYASMTRALTKAEVVALGGQPIWGLTPASPVGTTVRRMSGIGGDRIIVRNRFTFDPSMEVPLSRIPRVAPDHDRAFAARFPMLSGVAMQYRWGGHLCLSRNNVSVVKELETGLFAACCQNGLGTARGTLSGIQAAELASDVQSSLTAKATAESAPQKLPHRLIATLGATALIRWQEKTAGAEL
jgi:glycine/D-amino acid oxidase-like deaminating enzyme